MTIQQSARSNSPSVLSSLSPVRLSIKQTMEVDFVKNVKLAKDEFKTGNKHFYNMLRPSLYKIS
jgi:hypothetical protein